MYWNRHKGPCYDMNPSDCLRLPDGFYKHPHSEDLTLFIRCYQNRLEERDCPIDHIWGTQTYFYNGTCTHRFAIPTSEASYGLLPSCSSKQDGNYQAMWCLLSLRGREGYSGEMSRSHLFWRHKTQVRVKRGLLPCLMGNSKLSKFQCNLV